MRNRTGRAYAAGHRRLMNMWKSLLREWLESCVYIDPMAYTCWLTAKNDAELEARTGEEPASYRQDDQARHTQVAGGQVEASA